MEKKGEPLTQLAIIVDLLEKINIDSHTTKIIFELSDEDYYRTYNYINKMSKGRDTNPSTTFKITLGEVEIIFNRNNVEIIPSS
jgi:hypothetical protein